MFYDLGAGNDYYEAGACSLGAAMFGIALCYDAGGSDNYRSPAYTQGAAAFGVGILFDDTGDDPSANEDDVYGSSRASQGFARTRGLALCINRSGDELYMAGLQFMHSPEPEPGMEARSQGYAGGEHRGLYAGGIGLLADLNGDDYYSAGKYSQGVGYLNGAGLLWDGGGVDRFENKRDIEEPLSDPGTGIRLESVENRGILEQPATI